MKTADFFFEPPENLIAQYPPEERGKSRLMLLDRLSGGREHRMVEELPAILAGYGRPLLVFNNSRVRKARLAGRSLDGEKTAEFLLIDKTDPYTWRTLVEKSKRKKAGSRYVFGDGLEAEVIAPPPEERGFCYLRFGKPIDDLWLDMYGSVPLPPYISRRGKAADAERYQTVYADRAAGAGHGPGASVAAPTAGLHFTSKLLSELENSGIETVFVTLHVGLGTFLPVRTENIEDHIMHEEAYCVDKSAAEKINRTKAGGGTVIAVGTTAARVLEAASDENGCIRAGKNRTSIFIRPGYRFKIVDGLFTNFHTPCSTLLMMVSAFAENGPAGAAGRRLILESYDEAVREGYRFFSYGDAMFIYDKKKCNGGRPPAR
jgi:S-adenosylmethionine:tRNA ribosyltransferase-isomerase